MPLTKGDNWGNAGAWEAAAGTPNGRQEYCSLAHMCLRGKRCLTSLASAAVSCHQLHPAAPPRSPEHYTNLRRCSWQAGHSCRRRLLRWPAGYSVLAATPLRLRWCSSSGHMCDLAKQAQQGQVQKVSRVVGSQEEPGRCSWGKLVRLAVSSSSPQVPRSAVDYLALCCVGTAGRGLPRSPSPGLLASLSQAPGKPSAAEAPIARPRKPAVHGSALQFWQTVCKS